MTSLRIAPTDRGAVARDAWARLTPKRLGLGVALLALIAGMGMALLQDPTALIGAPNGPPSQRAWLGLDALGRDVWVRLVWGALPTLRLVTLILVGQCMLGGLSAALWVAASARGRQTLRRVGDALQLLPRLLVVVVAVAAWRTHPLLAASGALLLVGWPWLMQELGAAWLTAEAAESHHVAREMNAPLSWRLRHHLLPSLQPVLVRQAGLALISAVPVDASLALLGFGPPPPTATWGRMLQDGLPTLTQAPLAVLAPTVAMLALVALGHGLTVWGAERLLTPSEGASSP